MSCRLILFTSAFYSPEKIDLKFGGVNDDAYAGPGHVRTLNGWYVLNRKSLNVLEVTSHSLILSHIQLSMNIRTLTISDPGKKCSL